MSPLDPGQFPATGRWVYLNHAGISPLPLVSVAAQDRTAREVALDGEFSYPAHKVNNERVRAAGARLMGVPTDDVAFIKNTTEGLGIVASGLDWSPGDRVVIPDREFPSTLYPFLALQARGVIVDRVAPSGPGGTLPVESFARVIGAGPPPKLVVTSWVQFGTGWRTDLAALAELCHEAGAMLCVDVIQGLGAIPAQLQEWGVDFAMADGHKWLLGPEGSGFLYVRRSCLDLLRPLQPGWNSVRHREDWDNLNLEYDETARRFEGGMPNMTGIAALGASVDLLLETGVTQIWAHIDKLCDQICQELADVGGTVRSDRSPAGRSGIVAVGFDRLDVRILAQQLRERGFACSARSGALRISPHGYNAPGDIDQLAKALRTLTRSG